MTITNNEYIRQLPIESLAELLIQEEQINEGDEGIDGDWCDFYVTYYVTPSGHPYYDYEDALEHTIKWLNTEHTEKT